MKKKKQSKQANDVKPFSWQEVLLLTAMNLAAEFGHVPFDFLVELFSAKPMRGLYPEIPDGLTESTILLFLLEQTKITKEDQKVFDRLKNHFPPINKINKVMAMDMSENSHLH